MPSGYLHQTCAKRACAQSGVTPVQQDVLVLGAQGPDPLFTLGIFPLRPSSKPSGLGNVLHSYRTGAFLLALCRRAKASDDVARAYAMGFLTHYALDSTVHPYVYAHSNREDGSYSSTMHMALEKAWDTMFYRRDGLKGTPVIMPGVEETRALWPQIAALWQGAIDEVFPEQNVTVAMIEEALKSAAYAAKLTHSPRGIKYRLVWVLERIIGKPRLGTSQMSPPTVPKEDITNEAGLPWHSPGEPDRERTEGLAELFEAGTTRAAELLGAAAKYFSNELDEAEFARIVGNVGYDTGLESKP